ncbi:Cobalt/zinc/cadmium efflux RND transporter, membrane fusion protein, CzcB family [Labilithrix luteola]|uniref:Cobalt/zinc/cadmium efflux RND transporter, membrane fusion protein, CzcB family n=1 Tax=Labilithrix luteola TaxID=1391654 RepID=A0A0K1PYQ2_9BACT|nr:Cobalt/zinc/cadmium efflux RND transporter, membrane fusion protein, CzcB family [Labilithrix luteola]
MKVVAQLGNHVKKGDPLVVIESPDTGVATSDLGKAKADLVAAEHDHQRQKELLDAHATSQKDYEVASDNFRKAKAEMERAQQKARLFRQGDVTGQTFTLRSDIDGEVFMKAVSPGMEISGQYGGSSPELFTIGEADRSRRPATSWCRSGRSRRSSSSRDRPTSFGKTGSATRR